ncbi:M23 family metallopeptidase [Sphingobacterium deserti]|uniref:Putative lipoprotein n=1 Tax=Sphingobacterium deserti TaxID=1229276 RepID=A0A0B8T0N2_9SPHI|nr:M23 family metallopeptidase [Sphingobacterium deserti]KGE14207.1 putative lipoprotein [Sphingobacterium deserti]
MLKKKTAVLFVETDGTSTKRVQVPTLMVTHWKKILGSLVVLIAIAVFSVAYVVKQKTSEEYTLAYNKKIDLLNEEKRQLEKEGFNSQLTTDEMKKSFNSIDSTLERINKKMRTRGLKEIRMKNAGGPVENDDEDLVELSLFYKKQLKNLETKLDGMPFGVPHPGRITSPFGYRRNPFTNRGREMHGGVDLKGRVGDPVRATAKGKVAFAGYKGDYGYVVMVKHNNGFETRYAHLTRTRVKRGEAIEAGEIVGLLGSTGRSTGPHLHYEVTQHDKKLNPAKFFYF